MDVKLDVPEVWDDPGSPNLSVCFLLTLFLRDLTVLVFQHLHPGLEGSTVVTDRCHTFTKVILQLLEHLLDFSFREFFALSCHASSITQIELVVHPERLELSTSPLRGACSAIELRVELDSLGLQLFPSLGDSTDAGQDVTCHCPGDPRVQCERIELSNHSLHGLSRRRSGHPSQDTSRGCRRAGRGNRTLTTTMARWYHTIRPYLRIPAFSGRNETLTSPRLRRNRHLRGKHRHPRLRPH